MFLKFSTCLILLSVFVTLRHANLSRKEKAMSAIRQRMIEDMQLHGYSAKTQTAYLGAVRGLAGHYHRTPEDITQDELRSYFLYLVKERGVARSTLTIHLCGIKTPRHRRPVRQSLKSSLQVCPFVPARLVLRYPVAHVARRPGKRSGFSNPIVAMSFFCYLRLGIHILLQ